MRLHGEPAFALHCRGDAATPPALTRVDAHGRLDGVLFALTLRQTYRNAGDEPLEVVYSFPLPPQAVLLGLAAEFEGRRLQGHVLPREAAEQRYEDALARGDAPVLLEAGPDGIHTASLGNLEPGQSVTLELRFAQLLAFEQGRLRVSIPTTIAPRYGDAARAGLQPHQVPPHALDVQYPLSVVLTVSGALADAKVDCPTHAHALQPCDGGLRLTLEPGAGLDRDVVVLVTPASANDGVLSLAEDGACAAAPTVALAAFAVPRGAVRESVALRLLVDCSGSMGGDGIASARAALGGVLDALTSRDEASLTRFGSHVEHVVGAGPCTPQHLARMHAAVGDTDATMGGTELRAALESLFAAWPRHDGADVLLVTDGEVWQADEMVESARRSGHRVFAVGVGSAPAEGVLRRLAEATGGACEFAAPGESLRAAAARMLARMREEPLAALRIDWGAPPAWQAPVPAQAFGGDTVLALAGFAPGAAPGGAVRLESQDGGAPREVARTARRVQVDAQAGADLPRIAAAARLNGAGDAEALRLALDYQLVTRLTHCVLVHEHADEDRTTRQARLQRVPSMLAAGWGGTGTVVMSRVAPLACRPAVPRVFAHQPPRGLAAPLACAGWDDIDLPDFPNGDEPPPAHATLRDLMHQVAGFLAHGGAVADLVVQAQAWTLEPTLLAALDEVGTLGVGRARAWLLLALWVASREGQEGDAASGALLSMHAVDVEPAERRRVWGVLDRHLARVPSDSWETSRARRLARAIGRPL